MTEEEAKGKWCPIYTLAAWLIKEFGEGRPCIASTCMMWREHGPFHPDYKPEAREIGGFCGLAGR